MHIIVLASQKGGSGKTTLSGHLAVEAERTGGGPVVLIDTDPQGSLSQWWNAREAQAPAFAKVAIDDLGSALEELRRSGTRLAIIDTPPAITHSISQVVSHADLVLIPARPSPHDLRAVGATIDIAEHHGKPLIFIMNAATMRARITGEAAIALSQHGMVAPVTLHHRVDFAASMVDGKTIGEIDPKCRSAKEVSDLWTYVADRLARITRGPALAPLAVDLGIRTLTPLQPHPEVAEPAPPPLPSAPLTAPREDEIAEPSVDMEATLEADAEVALADTTQTDEWVSAINDGLPVSFDVDAIPHDANAPALILTAPAPEAPAKTPRGSTSPFPSVYERRGGAERRSIRSEGLGPSQSERRVKEFGRRRGEQLQQARETDAPEKNR